MEIALALIVFAVLILTWLVLPGSASRVERVDTPVWNEADNLQVTVAEA